MGTFGVTRLESRVFPMGGSLRKGGGAAADLVSPAPVCVVKLPSVKLFHPWPAPRLVESNLPLPAACSLFVGMVMEREPGFLIGRRVAPLPNDLLADSLLVIAELGQGGLTAASTVGDGGSEGGGWQADGVRPLRVCDRWSLRSNWVSVQGARDGDRSIVGLRRGGSGRVTLQREKTGMGFATRAWARGSLHPR